ncbi:hypothetical protein [Ulvibacter litoralis]|uniref:Uncharacterized protein n=1 Tax=Ulvibacter litoralis TaxID=227084 RepID=A0A1G7HCE4_9FLAO|nr:hypothetical protein [Ulvibacter litoralis]GHC57263.1 hypothetical protein GCM10008083_22230 [Ulvibacter litoralis]SDE98068.1 hypothetical protein SAMN05421855_1048 [Ulvibacter litoralis]
MKIITYTLTLFLVLTASFLQAQVGIGNSSPESTLDISASNASSPSNKDGILIPRINAFPTTNPGSEQNGMLVFLTTAIGTDDVGFYYWDNPNTRWVGIGAEEWKFGTNATGDKLIYATRAKLTGTDMVITDDGRIGFGTSDPIERFEFKGPGDNDIQITSANPNPPNLIFYNTGGSLAAPTNLANNGEIGALIVKTHDGNNIVENGGFRFYMDGIATPGSSPSKFVITTTPQGSNTQQQRISVRSNGNVGFSEQNPTATLHVRAGTASANSAPLKFTSGTKLATPEAGAMEYDGNRLYFTPESNIRQVLLKGYEQTATLNFPNIGNKDSEDLTVSVPGASMGDNCSCSPYGGLEVGLVWNCFINASNKVTIRVTNIKGGNINPSSRNWKVSVYN